MVDLKRQYLNFLASGKHEEFAEDDRVSLRFVKRTREVPDFEKPIPVIELEGLRTKDANALRYFFTVLDFIETHNPRSAVYLSNVNEGEANLIVTWKGYFKIDNGGTSLVNLVKTTAPPVSKVYKLPPLNGKGESNGV